MPDPLETAIAKGTRHAFASRAAALRLKAAKLVTTATDANGHVVLVVPPEARVMTRTADLLEECAEAAAPTLT